MHSLCADAPVAQGTSRWSGQSRPWCPRSCHGSSCAAPARRSGLAPEAAQAHAPGQRELCAAAPQGVITGQPQAPERCGLGGACAAQRCCELLRLLRHSLTAYAQAAPLCGSLRHKSALKGEQPRAGQALTPQQRRHAPVYRRAMSRAMSLASLPLFTKYAT